MIDTKKEDTDFPYPDKEHEKVERLLDFLFVELDEFADYKDYHGPREEKMRDPEAAREKI